MIRARFARLPRRVSIRQRPRSRARLTCIVVASRPRAKIRLPAHAARADKENGMMVFIAMRNPIAPADGREARHA
jgi:hypothetical protein